ncbi:MAG: Squalene/phytoene synthase [Bacteroidetes bacterium]|nr:Squalene/phytoene synthase [Bacteroidota bacterium]
MFDLFVRTAAECSKNVTQTYSTSFSLGIRTLHKRFRAPIYAIYGMVRCADEIVDTFHQFDKKYLLEKFRQDTFEAIDKGISLNPILFSFQKVVNEYHIPLDLIEAFFKSMETDLYETAYGQAGYEDYIYGSAEVVGLMCLRVFAEGDKEMYNGLEKYARALGAAFQKVNFLRDMGSDHDERGRIYFPGIDFAHFKEDSKRQIEAEVAEDFRAAYEGIMLLPEGAKGGVWLAYRYYLSLFHRIRKVSVAELRDTRVSVPDMQKFYILFSTVAHRQLRFSLSGAH